MYFLSWEEIKTIIIIIIMFWERENGAPLAFLSRLKLPFPSLSNACHAG